MSLEDLDDSDIETLRELLQLSGRAASERRKALCIEIGIDPGDLSAIWMLPENDFAIELIDLLQKRKLENSVCKLCEVLKSTFKGGKHASRLDTIIYKINGNYNSESGNSLSITPPKQHSNQLTQRVSEDGISKARFTGLCERFRQIFLNGFSLRTILIVSLTVTGTLIGLRFFAVLEWMELKAFDQLMQSRFLYEPEDPRLLIVTITDSDILAQDKRGEKGYGNSLRDPSLNRLLKTLERHQPRLIGLDLYRTFPADPSVPDLIERLKQNNIVTVCKVPKTDEQGNPTAPGVPPPKEVDSLNNIGFSDFVTDRDDSVRRHLMVQDRVAGTECRTKQSFSLLLARRYLEQESGKKIDYKNPIDSGENLQLGGVVFAQLQPFTGGYQDVDASGFQVLLNYRATASGNVAKILTLEDVLNNKFNYEDIHNKIVLIGSYAYQEGPRDQWSTPYGTIHGIMVHAHTISQVLSTVLDRRSLLHVCPQGVEIVWIWGWSIVGGVLACYWRSLKALGIALSCGFLVLYVTCLTSLTVVSLWIPLVPPTLALIGTSFVVIYINSFYRDRTTPLANKL